MSLPLAVPEERLQRTSGETDTGPCSLDHHFTWNQRIAAACRHRLLLAIFQPASNSTRH